VYIYRDFEVAELDPGMELSSKLQLAELWPQKHSSEADPEGDDLDAEDAGERVRCWNLSVHEGDRSKSQATRCFMLSNPFLANDNAEPAIHRQPEGARMDYARDSYGLACPSARSLPFT
jgi:hypothetical protein